MTEALLLCDCSLCKRRVDGSRSIRVGGQHFCSEVCAKGHPNMEPCDGKLDGCHCGTGELALLFATTD